MGEVIERIIARDNLERPNSPFARMPAPPPPQRAGPSRLNAHLPPFRRRVDSSDEEEPERPVWPPRRPHLEFDDGDYEQEEDTEPQPVRRRKNARRRENPFIDTEAGVDGNTSSDEQTDDENDDLDGFIVADDVEYEIIYHLNQFIKYVIVLVHYIFYNRPLYISHAFIFSARVISISCRPLLVFHGPSKLLFQTSDHNSSFWTNSMW